MKKSTSFKHVIAIVLFSGSMVFLFAKIFSPPQLRPDYSDSFLPPAILNEEVLSVIASYPADGSIKTVGKDFMGKIGVSQDLYYQGKTVVRAQKGKMTHCSGITIEVYMKACEKAAGVNYTLNQISAANFLEFRKDWYGTDGNKRTLVDALVSRGLGREIVDPTNARPGDFIQFWRMNGSGHSAVLLDWIYNAEGLISGFKYWSSDSLDGGKSEAHIGPEAWDVNPEKIYIVRAYEP